MISKILRDKTVRAAFSASAAFLGIIETARALPPATSESRPMTEGEAKLFSDIFRDEADPKLVKMHAGPSHGNVIAEVFHNNSMAFYGHPYLSLDYSKERNEVNFGTFIHESVHIWQVQKGDSDTEGYCSGDYIYVLSKDKGFNNFCHEQQGAILEDYSRRFLMNEPAESKWFSSVCKHDTLEHDALLLDTVESRFPGAREKRTVMGRDSVIPGTKSGIESAATCKKPIMPPPVKQPENCPLTPPEKGLPVFFCQKLEDAVDSINKIAIKNGLNDWPGFETQKNLENAACILSIKGRVIGIIDGNDFDAGGEIKPEVAQRLVIALREHTPPGIREAVRDSLSDLFSNMLEKQREEINALWRIKNQQEAVKKLEDLQDQLKKDPSLTNNAKGFVQKKISLLQEIIIMFDRGQMPIAEKKPVSAKPLTDGKGKPGAHKPNPEKISPPVAKDGAGGRPPAGPAKPAAPKKPVVTEQEKKDTTNYAPDKNIKQIIDLAFSEEPVQPSSPRQTPKKTTSAKGPAK